MRHTHLSALLTFLAATAIANCVALSSPAEARGHHQQYRQDHRHHHLHYGRHDRDRPQTIAAHSKPHASRHAVHGHRAPGGNSTGLASVSGSLAAKTQEIVASCQSAVISAFRPGARIAGSGHPSMHASGRAVDIRGNPGCIYSHLHGWAGGYSTDYASVQHVHISLGGREDGLRFVHHSSRHAHARHG
jgi:hypothetical protein